MISPNVSKMISISFPSPPRAYFPSYCFFQLLSFSPSNFTLFLTSFLFNNELHKGKSTRFLYLSYHEAELRVSRPPADHLAEKKGGVS